MIPGVGCLIWSLLLWKVSVTLSTISVVNLFWVMCLILFLFEILTEIENINCHC
jgi:hypothetical protein